VSQRFQKYTTLIKGPTISQGITFKSPLRTILLGDGEKTLAVLYKRVKDREGEK
jgi:hypothetical protein